MGGKSFIGKEMDLPMEHIIGSPLVAIIKAQSLAANSTAKFINHVGMETVDVPAHGSVDATKKSVARMVDFEFERNITKADNTPGVESVNISVPLLTIIPVPFIRIQQATIDFECNVSSTTVDTSETKFGVDASVSGGFFGVDVSVKSSFSTQHTHKNEVTRSACLKVHVEAVQDQIPAGLQRILDILQTAIKETATPKA